MPSLSDKLKSLGVSIGTHDLKPRPETDKHSAVDRALGGHSHPTRAGDSYVVEAHYPVEYRHGRKSLALNAPRQRLASWAGDARIGQLVSEEIAFLDTETTGLSGGTGTYAFLVGVGRLEGDTFHLMQFFMRDPSEEPAQLAALEAFIAPCQALVTYNGKAFDVPLLNTRYTVNGAPSPLNGLAHVDLLHLARRLWRDRLPSRRLGDIEYQILQTTRTEEDIPGWLIPDRYFEYLRSGDASPLRHVFYHNAMDVLSLSTLLDHVASVLNDPLHEAAEHGIDLLALARLFEDLGELEAASRLYIEGLAHQDVQDLRVSTALVIKSLHRLAGLQRRANNLEPAVSLWEQAAELNDLEAHVELAKEFEHHQRDYPLALRWTERAMHLVSHLPYSTFTRRTWLQELSHRKRRLERKIAGKSVD